jgi:hypothetical protein
MQIMKRIRIYHAVLAILAVLAYASGEMGIVHAWLGYAVALVVVLRLLWVLSGERELGLMRFYPRFVGLNQAANHFTYPVISKMLLLGIAISLIGVSLTGIWMDKGESLGLHPQPTSALVLADDDDEQHADEEDGWLMETHEVLANLMLIFVGLHVAYVFLFKRSLGKFMLFFPASTAKKMKGRGDD